VGGSGLLAPFTFTGGAFPGGIGTCTSTIPAGGSCTIEVTYAPTTPAISNDTIDINYNDGAALQTSSRDVQGTGVTPALITISEADPFDFGLIANGGTTTHTFTLTNSGASSAASISEVGMAAPFNFLGAGYPGTGGDCAATLGPAATCNIVIEFAPMAVNSFSDTIDLSYNDGAASQNALRDIQGTGGAPALLDITGPDPYDYGDQATTSITTATLTITNSGAVPATAMSDNLGLSAPFTFTGGTYPGGAGDCAVTLAAAASCTIEVDYNPTTTGVQTDTIDISYVDGATNQNLTHVLQGNGVGPAVITITEADPYDFGSVTENASSTHIFTLTNTGGLGASAIADIGMAAPFAFSGAGFPGTGGTCGTTLAPTNSCDIEVEFTPTSTGLLTDTISMQYNNGATLVTSDRDVQGTGIAPALLAVSDGPGNYDYGTVPTSLVTVHTFTISNSGGSTALGIAGSGLAAPFTFVGGVFPGGAGTCVGTLAAAASCTIEVQYNPVAISAGDTDVILIDYNDGAASQQATRGVDGIAVAPALITISESDPFNFGTLATGATNNHTFTLTNAGGFQASSISEVGIAAPFLFFGGSFPGTGGDCTSNLNAGATCDIVIQYGPSTSAVHNDSIDVSYNDGVNTQNSLRAITGTGVLPALLTISESDPYDYGTVAIGSSSTNAFVVSNSGEHQATAMTEISLTAPFQFVGGTFPGIGGTCTASLNPSTSCTLFVEFSPTGTGISNDDIQLWFPRHNSGNSKATYLQFN